MRLNHPLRTLRALACLLGALLLSCTATAGLTEKTFSKRSYANSENRTYYVYTPSSYNGSQPLPLVMMLHGCKQDHKTVINEFGWDETAEKYGFILVAPFITTYEGLRNPNCWGFWDSFDYEIHQGGGEVEDLVQIAKEVEASYAVDGNRRYIGGLSSGAFMADTAAVAHNEYWAAAFVASGGGYKETSSVYNAGTCPTPRYSAGTFKNPDQIVAAMNAEMNSDYRIPMMLFHSTNDCSVGHGSPNDNSKWGGLNSNREAWLKRSGGTLYASASCTVGGYACTHRKYGLTNARSTVETVSFDGSTEGKGHFWSGGKAAGEYTRTDGPNAREIAWEFFSRHSRAECTSNCPTPPAAPGGLAASNVGDSGATISWTANGEPDLVGYNLYRNGTKLNASPLTATSYADSGLASGTTYKYTVKAFDSENLESAASAELSVTTTGAPPCQSYTATNDQHVAAGRATKTTSIFWPYTTTYYAKGTNENLGTSGLTTVTLYSSNGTSFSKTSCQTGGGGGGTAPCFTDTNTNHKAAARATYEFVMGTGYSYLAVGSKSNLGAFSTTVTSLRETTAGFWDKVASCQ